MESIVSDVKRNLYLLLIRDGGFRITILEECASIHKNIWVTENKSKDIEQNASAQKRRVVT